MSLNFSNRKRPASDGTIDNVKVQQCGRQNGIPSPVRKKRKEVDIQCPKEPSKSFSANSRLKLLRQQIEEDRNKGIITPHPNFHKSNEVPFKAETNTKSTQARPNIIKSISKNISNRNLQKTNVRKTVMLNSEPSTSDSARNTLSNAMNYNNEVIKENEKRSLKRFTANRQGAINVKIQHYLNQVPKTISSTPESINLERANALLDASLCSCTHDPSENLSMEWEDGPTDFSSKPPETKLQKLSIVVDTNILLSNLTLMQTISSMNIVGIENHTVVVPWMVLQELDYMKDDKRQTNSLQTKAQAAIKFINKHLQNRNSKVKGQTVKDAIEQSTFSNTADDGILSCCLQIKIRGDKAILLSNDVNLRNKVIINEMEAYDDSNILNILNSSNENCKISTKVMEIKTLLTQLCNGIITKEMSSAYGTTWKMMDLMDKSSWTLEESLEIFKKYWRTVFSMLLQKQCQKIFQDLQDFLHVYPSGNIVDEANEFFKICLTLCVYFKNGFPDKAVEIKECSKNMQEIAFCFTNS